MESPSASSEAAHSSSSSAGADYVDPRYLRAGGSIRFYDRYAIKTYALGPKCGKGTFGTVYKARCSLDGDLCAIKCVPFEDDDGVIVATLREAAVIRALQHPNIVRLRDMYRKGLNLYIVMDYEPWTLHAFCATKRATRVLVSIAEQVLMAVAYIHSQGIMHRDITDKNVLVTDDGQARVADFSLSRYLDCGAPPPSPSGRKRRARSYTNPVIALNYRAPEIILGSVDYGQAIDVWSVGILVAFMFDGIPFAHDRWDGKIWMMRDALGPIYERTWPGVTDLPLYRPEFGLQPPPGTQGFLPDVPEFAREFILALLVYSPKERPTAESALNHRFFNTPDSTEKEKDNQ